MINIPERPESDTEEGHLVQHAVPEPVQNSRRRCTVGFVVASLAVVALVNHVKFSRTLQAVKTDGISSLSAAKQTVRIGADVFHWWIAVGSKIYQVKENQNDCTNDGCKNFIDTTDHRSFLDLEKARVVGVTWKTQAEIEAFNKDWLSKHPNYGLLDDNCEKYATDLASYVTDGNADVQRLIGGTGTQHQRAGAYSTRTKVRATTGAVRADAKFFGASAEGPNAGASADSSGAFANAELFHTEENIGPIHESFAPNVNTGAKATNGHVDVRAAGFGVSVGDQTELHTPLGSVFFR